MPSGNIKSQEVTDVVVKEQYHVKVSNRFEAFKCLDKTMDANMAWENY